MEVSDDGKKVYRTIERADIVDIVEDAYNIIDKSNYETDYDFYDALVDLDPELAGAIQSISLTGADYDIVSASSEDDAIEAQVIIKKLFNKLKMPVILVASLRNMIMYGNDVNFIHWDTTGISYLQLFPINAMTALDKGMQPGNVNGEVAIRNPDRYFYKEGVSEYQIEMKKDEVWHLKLNARGSWVTDVLGRSTFGVWGKSRIKPLKMALQSKYNSMINRLGMEKSIIAREVYTIDYKELFGHITDRSEQEKLAKAYRDDLKKLIKALKPDERAILPKDVTRELQGAKGKIPDNTPFLELMNLATAAVLNFPAIGLGREQSSSYGAGQAATLWAEKSIKHFKLLLRDGVQELIDKQLEFLGIDLDLAPKIVYYSLSDEDKLATAHRAKIYAQMGIMRRDELRKMIPDEIDELPEGEGGDEFIQIGGGGGSV